MPDRRCFVQFPHPGGEHEPDRGGKVGWNKLHRPHKRKFMRLRAEWIDEDGNRHSGDLHAWGEWEPESEVIPDFVPQDSDPHAPRHLWRPYWIPRNTYRGLHNTDPFIFGERFLYSNCGQAAPSKAGLKRLGEGSVIAFGSGKMVGGKRKWVLDTVLVIKDSIAFDPLDPRGALAGNVPDAFLSVIGGPLADDPKLARKPVEGGFRLYQGATPDDPVCGMYSFFPASPASDESCFPRPVVSLDGDHFNPRSWQTPKGTRRELLTDELRRLWDSLVEQVRGAGLVLGTYAQLPGRRLG